MLINVGLKLDVLFTISTCCRQNLSKYEHCSELNKVTKHKLVKLQRAQCSHRNVILNGKKQELALITMCCWLKVTASVTCPDVSTSVTEPDPPSGPQATCLSLAELRKKKPQAYGTWETIEAE